MSSLLLLDEMFSDTNARQLCAQGHDVIAVVADPALVSLPDGQYRAAGESHGGLILVSTKTFPQDRCYTRAVISALAALLGKDEIQPDRVIFLARH